MQDVGIASHIEALHPAYSGHAVRGCGRDPNASFDARSVCAGIAGDWGRVDNGVASSVRLSEVNAPGDPRSTRIAFFGEPAPVMAPAQHREVRSRGGAAVPVSDVMALTER